MNKQSQATSGHLIGLLAILSLALVLGTNKPADLGLPELSLDNLAVAVQASELEEVKLTGKLVTWISEQCEQMAQEMDAIIQLEAAESAERFSLVNYMRYLALYQQLSAVAKRTDVDKFRWIAKKIKAYTRAYNSASSLLMSYLNGLDAGLTEIENAERKSRQDAVGKDWVQKYETVNYIASHAPADSELAKVAYEVMQKSPNGTQDKKRSTRYALYTRIN